MDCRETKNYLKEKRRMCETIKYCDGCPFYDFKEMDCFVNDPTKPINEEEVIATVQKWSDENMRLKLYINGAERTRVKPMRKTFLRSFRKQSRIKKVC